MSFPQRVLELENRANERTLAEAYAILKEQWHKGNRDREIGLHLMFLAWYGLVEPGDLTGFSKNEESMRELNHSLKEVHEYFEPWIYQDAEMLYVVGLAASMFWFMFEDAPEWEKRSIEYQQLYRALVPNGIDPKIFNNRGFYGQYYAGQAKVEGGY